MDGQTARISLLGVRGTVPVGGAAFTRYGGATSCVLVRMGGETIVLDAGTGMLSLTRRLRPEEGRVHLLLSHAHADHLLGLPVCAALREPARQWHVLGVPREGMTTRQCVERLVSPPLWPVGMDGFGAHITFGDLSGESFSIGAVRVDLLEGAHPGGCTVFRLSSGGASLVYATDYELDGSTEEPLREFARGATLLLLDAQYTEEEYGRRHGYGHSSFAAAARLARDCGARTVRFIHHDPYRTDAALDAAQAAVSSLAPAGRFARGGEEFLL